MITKQERFWLMLFRMRLTHLVVSFGFVACVVCSSVAADEPQPILTDAALQQILQQRINNKKAVGIVVGRIQGTNRSIVAAGTMALATVGQWTAMHLCGHADA